MSRKKFFTIALIYTSLIFFLSLRPVPEEVSALFPYQDKLFHLLAYFLMGSLYLRGMEKRVYAVALTISIGILIEVLQSLTAYRSFELLDIVANTLGAVSAMASHHR